MNYRLALRSVFLILVFIAALELIDGLLVNSGKTEMLVPSPETTAQQLVGALGARRFEGVFNELSEELRAQTTTEDLKNLATRIEQDKQGIENVSPTGSQEQGDTATAQVEIEWGNRETQEVVFPLVKENQIWKISSLAPLE